MGGQPSRASSPAWAARSRCRSGTSPITGSGSTTARSTTWTDVDGYLPAQITTFHRSGAVVSITEFADRVVLGGDAYVAVYSRVAVHNPTNRVVEADPEPSPGLVPLDDAPVAVEPHASVQHDYVVAVDRFGNAYPWPTSEALAQAGGFDEHFAHMRAFWDGQLATIAQIQVPDVALEDAYRSGFITTQIARSGNDLDTGVNGYESEFSHDVIGILTNLFTQGDFQGAHALLLEARNVVGSQAQYVDGVWTYSVPWAVYLEKTGDLGFVKANFADRQDRRVPPPSRASRTPPTRSPPTGRARAGPWRRPTTSTPRATGPPTTSRPCSGWPPTAIWPAGWGIPAEEAWASQQYSSLLSATNTTLEATIHRYDLDYLPCSLLQPDTANRCANPEDANWASPIRQAGPGRDRCSGRPIDGPGQTLIDATYAYGFGRLKGKLPPDTFGGFPDDYFSSGYNAAYGTAGLAGGHRLSRPGDPELRVHDRQQPERTVLVVGELDGTVEHRPLGRTPPDGGTRLVAARLGDGRGQQGPVGLAGGPGGRRLADRRSWRARRLAGTRGPSPSPTSRVSTDGGWGSGSAAAGTAVTLALSGRTPPGPVLFELPAFVDNIASTTAGSIAEKAGKVEAPQARGG